MLLCDSEIFKHVINESMVTNYTDLQTQVQTNGMDLTLDQVASILDGVGVAVLDFSNLKREIPKFQSLTWTEDGIPLPPGHYLFRSSEIFKMPADIAGFCFPRSSLSRCGAFFDSAVVDAGYEGPLEFPVQLIRPVRFYYRARFAQIAFIRLDEKPEKLYSGIYKRPR